MTDSDSDTIYTTEALDSTDSLLGLGDYTFTITATDSSTDVTGGNSAESDGTDAFSIVDTTGPSITDITVLDSTSTPVTEVEYGETFTIIADISDLANTVASAELTITDGGTYAMTDNDADGVWTTSAITAELPDFDVETTYSISITATDSAGYAATSDETSGTDSFEVVDTTAAEIIAVEVNGDNPVVCYEDDMIVYATAEDNYDDPVNYVVMSILDPSGIIGDAELSPDTSGSGYSHTRTFTFLDLQYYGDYYYSFAAYDAAGNTPTGDMFEGTFTVADCTAPEFGTVTANDIVYGVDDLTITAEVADVESGIAAVTVDVYDATGNIVEDTGVMEDPEADGTYEVTFLSADFTTLGTYSFTITATNGDDYTEEASGTFEVTDETQPTVDGITLISSPVAYGDVITVEVTVSDDYDGADVASVTLTLDVSGTPIDLDPTSTEGVYSAELDTLADFGGETVGLYDYSIEVFDTSGNSGTALGSDFGAEIEVVDTTYPVVVVSVDPATVDFGDDVTITATVTDDVEVDASTVLLEIQDSTGTVVYGPTVMDPAGTDTYETTLNSITDLVGVESYTFTVTAEDSSGLDDEDSGSFDVVDNDFPEIEITGDNPMHVELGEAYVEEGATATDVVDGELAVTISGDTVDGSVEGTYTVTYSATDSNGNTASEDRTVEVSDTTDPVINSVSLSATRVNEGDTITFTVDVTDNQGIDSVILTTNGADYDMEDPEGDGTYTVDVDTTGFALDTYSYTITATDDSGNTDSATGTYDVTIVSPMTVRILADKTSGEEDLDVSFASSVDAGGAEPFTYSWSFGDGHTDSSKNVRHVFTRDGTYTVTLTVRDQYGNEGSASVVITVSEEASSNNPRNNIQITGLSIPNDVVEAGDVLEISVDVENIGNSRLNDVSMTVFIPELGIWQRTTAEDIRTGDDETFTVGLDIPADVEPGIYDVRITVSNDDYNRVKHRDIVIE
jgi:PKD repeat protein